jgi:hypothetical protein
VRYFLRRNIDTSTASHARPIPPMMVMSHCCHVTRVNSNSTALIQLMTASQGGPILGEEPIKPQGGEQRSGFLSYGSEVMHAMKQDGNISNCDRHCG